MSTEIKVIARSVPAIAIVLGFLLIFSGISIGNEEMTNSGWTLIIIGFVLQVLYLISRTRW